MTYLLPLWGKGDNRRKKFDLHICTILARYIILIMGYKWNIIVVNIQYIIYVLKKLNGPGTAEHSVAARQSTRLVG